MVRTPGIYPLPSRDWFRLQVVSSVREVFNPPGIVLENPSLEIGKNPVYNWLEEMRANVFTDSVCGNGVCEPPYEFSSYET